MIWRITQLWIVIGVCIFELSINVNALEHRKIKNKNAEHLNKFHLFFDENAPNVDLDLDVIIDPLLESDLGAANLKRLGRKVENETKRTVNRGLKYTINKIYNGNKIHSLNLNKADETKSNNKKNNLLLRLFSDGYKPYTQKTVLSEKSDGFTDIFFNHNSSYPTTAWPIFPLSHLENKNRKMNKICKAQIINIYPIIKKNFKNKFETGSELHRQSIFGDSDWEVSQGFFEGMLPFREKSDMNFQDFFQDETKNLFNDIQADFQNILKIAPFSFFDKVFIKLSTEKPKIHFKIKKGNLNKFHNFFENLRNKRQVTESSLIPNVSSHMSIANDKHLTTHRNDSNSTFKIVNDTQISENKTIPSLPRKELFTVKLHKETSTVFNASFVGQNVTTPLVDNDYVQSDDDDDFKNLSDTVSTDIPVIPINTREIKDKKTNFVDLFEMQENEIDHNPILENAEKIADTKVSKESDAKAFLIVLSVIPGIVGLIIIVTIVVIWLVQNKSWMSRNSPRNEGNSGSQPKSASC